MSEPPEEPAHVEEGGGGLAWRRRLVVALFLIVGVSMWARASTKPEPAPAAANAPAHGLTPQTQLVPGEQPPPPQEEAAEPEPQGLKKLLPFLTEGGIAMLLGLALGMATRTFAKMIVFLLALVFVSVQFLTYKGFIGDVDWGGIAAWLRGVVLNVSDSESGLGAIVQHKLPSAGSLLIGYYLGLKRG